MTTRPVETEPERQKLILLIEGYKLPFIAELTPGRRRSIEQNRLQRKWMTEVAEQLPGSFESAEDVRAYCKLTIGVPILREENETFRAKYDEVVRPLPYEQKIAIMSEPLDMPVTRLMTTKQGKTYLDRIFRHFSEKGVELTIPPDKRTGPPIDHNPQEPASSSRERGEGGEDAVTPAERVSASSPSFGGL